MRRAGSGRTLVSRWSARRSRRVLGRRLERARTPCRDRGRGMNAAEVGGGIRAQGDVRKPHSQRPRCIALTCLRFSCEASASLQPIASVSQLEARVRWIAAVCTLQLPEDESSSTTSKHSHTTGIDGSNVRLAPDSSRLKAASCASRQYSREPSPSPSMAANSGVTA